MRKSIVHFAAAGAFALAGAAPAPAQAPETAWVTKTAHGLRFALAVESVLDPEASGDPRHARDMDHRIVVAIRDAASERPVQVFAVSLDVAEQGYQGTLVPMRPVGGDGAAIYEARVRLRTGLPHRILVYATPHAGARTLAAQFEYRHHH